MYMSTYEHKKGDRSIARETKNPTQQLILPLWPGIRRDYSALITLLLSLHFFSALPPLSNRLYFHNINALTLSPLLLLPELQKEEEEESGDQQQ